MKELLSSNVKRWEWFTCYLFLKENDLRGEGGHWWVWLFTTPKELFFQLYKKEILSKPDFRLNVSLEWHTKCLLGTSTSVVLHDHNPIFLESWDEESIIVKNLYNHGPFLSCFQLWRKRVPRTKELLPGSANHHSLCPGLHDFWERPIVKKSTQPLTFLGYRRKGKKTKRE